MGTPLGPKYIPYTYMDPLGLGIVTPQDRSRSRSRSPGRPKRPVSGQVIFMKVYGLVLYGGSPSDIVRDTTLQDSGPKKLDFRSQIVRPSGFLGSTS